MHDGTRRIFIIISTLTACGLLVFYSDIENGLSTISLKPSSLFGSVGYNLTDTLSSVRHDTANLTATSPRSTSPRGTSPFTIAMTVAPPDISHVDYLITNNICRNDDDNITALVMVTSHAGNLEQRQLVRDAYPASTLLTLGLRRIFLLATPIINQTEPGRHYFPITNNQIITENHLHGDLLQVDLLEGYNALTLKNLAGLRWASTHCARANFILKTDDDVIVDLYQLAQFLRDVREEDQDKMIGRVWNQTVPRRFKSSKYYISRTEWRPYFLPVYTSGIVYMTSPKTAAAIVDMSVRVPFFKMEDIYITGMVGARLGLRYLDLGDRFTNLDYMACCYDNKTIFQCDKMAGLNEKRNDITLLERVAQHSRNCHRTGKCELLGDRDTSKMTCF